jgi:hypothetical protein
MSFGINTNIWDIWDIFGIYIPIVSQKARFFPNEMKTGGLFV